MAPHDERGQDGCQRYNELPIYVRRHLEGMTPEMIEAQNTFVRRPEKVRNWLLNLDEQDIDVLERIKESYRNATVISRFLKWIGVTMFLVFMGMAGAFEKIMLLIRWALGKQ